MRRQAPLTSLDGPRLFCPLVIRYTSPINKCLPPLDRSPLRSVKPQNFMANRAPTHRHAPVHQREVESIPESSCPGVMRCRRRMPCAACTALPLPAWRWLAAGCCYSFKLQFVVPVDRWLRE
uniref:Uncharacterized protein n=1 Tax=Fagus sylvatica TaxID=28930 RepID=A0A2N9FAM4_FAGSY